MLPSPKKRIYPSLKARIFSNIRRHAEGEIRGDSPSITSSSASASACQSMLVFKTDYFFAGAAALLLDPRMALKKSDEGSTTMTSLFLLKLAL